MANSRYYSSTAQATTLTGGISPSNTTMNVASTAGFPGSLPYTLAVDFGALVEELVEVTAVAGLSLTVTRAIDGTSAASHNAGAVVRHVASARDMTDSRTHEAASTNVHGLAVGSAVVGTTDTQTLTNKTVTNLLGSARNFTMYNVGGTGITQIIGDSANPNSNRLEIKDNESALNIMTKVTGAGALFIHKQTADTAGTYRIRVTDNDQSTDRFSVLAGGTIAVTPTSGTTFVANDIVLPDTDTTKRAIRVAASGGGTERFTVWNDGRVDVLGTATTFSTFDVTGPASHGAAYMRVMDSGTNNLFDVASTGLATASASMDVKNIRNTGGVSAVVLRIFGRNPGQTGDLTQWVDSSNVIQASVAADGTFNFSKDPVFSGATNWSAYTVTVSGGGSATFTTTDGFYYKIGKIVFFRAYWTVGTAGTGATVLTVTMPSTPYRNGFRQSIPGGLRDGGSVTGPLVGLVFAGGAGATLDRMVLRDGTDAVGTSLTSGSIWSVEGWYREA